MFDLFICNNNLIMIETFLTFDLYFSNCCNILQLLILNKNHISLINIQQKLIDDKDSQG